MSVMIKLQLPGNGQDFNMVRSIPGLNGLNIDASFGLLLIDPKESLYVVRADYVDKLDERKKLSPEILDAYGDVRISTA